MTPLSRHTQGWLLLTQLVIILPLLGYCTPWSMLVVALCLAWRLGIFFGRVARPPRLLVNLMGAAALLIMLLVLSQANVLTTLINLLVLAYGLKAIEIRHRGDLAAVVLTGFFLVGLQMLTHNTPLWIALQWCALGLNLAVLVSAYRPGPRWSSAGPAFRLMLVSLPLAVVLFLVLPRSGGLWSLSNNPTARTGLSDTMALGEISRLGRTAEPVLTATFPDGVPPPQDRYWRALVLEHYDGERWHAAVERVQLSPGIEPEGPSYQVQVEAGSTLWLPALEFSHSDHPAVLRLDQQRLAWRLPPLVPPQLTLVRGAPRSANEDDLDRWRQLPKGGNPRSRALAAQLVQQLPPRADGVPDSRDFSKALWQRFSQAPYRYTLSPPALGRQQMDSFLFDNEAGFCGHYASSLVYLARAAGIPARIVTGYQGGEVGANGRTLKLYQYHAHAWAELWQPGLGWFRVDPTAAVAPSRIERGALDALGAEPDFLADAPLARWARQWYGQGQQLLSALDHWQAWLRGTGSEGSRFPIGAILLTLTAAVTLGAGLWLQRRQRGPRGTLALYRKMENRLAQQGLGPRAGETPDALLGRLSQEQPALAAPLAEFVHHFQALRYDPSARDPAPLRLAWQRLDAAIQALSPGSNSSQGRFRPPEYPKQRRLLGSRTGPEVAE